MSWIGGEGRGPRARRQEALESEFLESIIENLPDMIFVKDAEELRFVRFNRAGEDLLGYSRDELLGKNDYDFFPEEQADFFTQKDREVLEGRELVDIPEEPIHTRAKGTRVLHTKKIPILDEDGTPAFLLGISEDITELKHLQEERRRREELERAKRESDKLARRVQRSEAALDNVMQSVPDGILVLDADGNVVEANRAAVELFGGPRREDLLRSVEELAPYFERCAPEALSWREISEKVASAEWGTYESRLRRDDGGAREVEVRASALARRDWQFSVILVLRDVSKQKRLESLRDEFLSIAAHELKTPLTTIKGYAQVMRTWSAPELEERGKRVLDTLDRQTDRLSRLVQELLEVSRLQLGTLALHKEEVDLGSLVRQVIEEMQHTAPRHRIVIERSSPVLAIVDRSRIEQVLGNLLSNAIKFSPHSDVVYVYLERRGDEAVVTVRDFGIGIPADQQDGVFERYFQAHRDTEYAMTAGLGMGLYISRELIHRHGGDIGYESREGEGSTFYFSLPLESGKP